MHMGVSIHFVKADGETSTAVLCFDFQLDRDLLHERPEANWFDMLFILIQRTRRSIRYPGQTRKQSTALSTDRAGIEPEIPAVRNTGR